MPLWFAIEKLFCSKIRKYRGLKIIRKWKIPKSYFQEENRWNRIIRNERKKINNCPPVFVKIVYNFLSVSDLETVSQFPHQQRHSLANMLIDSHDEGFFHKLPKISNLNQFGQKVVKLFQPGTACFYWTHRLTDITLIFSGFQISIILARFRHFSCHCVHHLFIKSSLNAGYGYWTFSQY